MCEVPLKVESNEFMHSLYPATEIALSTTHLGKGERGWARMDLNSAWIHPLYKS